MVRRKNYILMAIGVLLLVCLLTLTNGLTLCHAGSKGKQFQKIPFQLNFSGKTYPGQEQSKSYTVQEDRRMVIEFASAFVEIKNGEFPVITIETSVDGTLVKHYMTMVSVGVLSVTQGDYFVGSQKMRVYADPGTTLTITSTPFSDCTNGTCGQFNFSVSISGYLERY